jgi:long-chain acyl-CoA synthetase
VPTVSSFVSGVVKESTQTEFEVPQSLEYPDMPAWGLVDRAARLMPGRLACHYNNLEWSWEELNEDAKRAADMLRRLGVQPGDRVGILLPNCPEYIIALNGIWRAGAIAVAISPLSVVNDVDKLLELTDCKTVVCLDMLAHLLTGETSPERALYVSLRPQLPLFQ